MGYWLLRIVLRLRLDKQVTFHSQCSATLGPDLNKAVVRTTQSTSVVQTTVDQSPGKWCVI